MQAVAHTALFSADGPKRGANHARAGYRQVNATFFWLRAEGVDAYALLLHRVDWRSVARRRRRRRRAARRGRTRSSPRALEPRLEPARFRGIASVTRSRRRLSLLGLGINCRRQTGVVGAVQRRSLNCSQLVSSGWPPTRQLSRASAAFGRSNYRPVRRSSGWVGTSSESPCW